MPLADPDLKRTWLFGPGADAQALDAAIGAWKRELEVAPGETAILPVCETALGVLDVRAIAAGSARIRAALLGAEHLAADLRTYR